MLFESVHDWVVQKRALAFLVLLLAAGTAGEAQDVDPMDLPPGVRLVAEIPAASRIPQGLAIEAIEVDWTRSDLSVAIAVGGPKSREALHWDSLDLGDDTTLKIHLAGYQDERSGGEREHVILPPEVIEVTRQTRAHRITFPVLPEASKAGGAAYTYVGGIAPWTYAGDEQDFPPGWNADLAYGATRLDAHWAGTVEAWLRNPPDFKFERAATLSTLNPMSGQGSFLQIQNKTSRPVNLAGMTEWLEITLPAHHLIAVHSLQGEGLMGMGEWRMGLGPDDIPERTSSAVLMLRTGSDSEVQDLARLHRVRITSSSSEIAYPASQTISGRLWPVSMRPPMWISRTTLQGAGAFPWIEYNLDGPGTIDQIRLIFAGAAGWSSEFNPAQVQLILRSGDEFDAPLLIPVQIKGSVAFVSFPRSLEVQSLRVEFVQPQGNGLPAPGRLMAVQMLGELRRRQNWSTARPISR